MELTLKQAADKTGKSKQAIQQAIKKGKISAHKNSNREWRIDAAELFRVYSPVNNVDTKKSSTIDDALHIDLRIRNKELELENKAKDKEISMLSEKVEDFKEQRDKWQEQATKLLLTYESEKATEQNSVKDQVLLWFLPLFGLVIIVLLLIMFKDTEISFLTP